MTRSPLESGVAPKGTEPATETIVMAGAPRYVVPSDVEQYSVPATQAEHDRQKDRDRAQREDREHKQALHMRLITFYVLGSLFIALYVAAACAAFLSSDPTMQVWSRGLVVSLSTAVAGYLVGKKA